MRRVLIIFMLLATIQAPAEDHPQTTSSTAGVAAADSAYDTVAISMMLWGTGLAVGIALLAGLLDQSKGANGDNGNGGNGGNGHAHTTTTFP